MRHPNIPFSQGLFCLEGKRRPIETALECRLVFGPATSFNTGSGATNTVAPLE